MRDAAAWRNALVSASRAIQKISSATCEVSEPEMALIAEAESGKQALALFEQHLPDITLMDLRLGDMNGIDVIKEIRSNHADARIIVLTTCPGDVQALPALKACAMGYLMKATLRRDLLDTIRTVHAGRRRGVPKRPSPSDSTSARTP
jgi:DNA-binding NarL/FixJ family response regulator